VKKRRETNLQSSKVDNAVNVGVGLKDLVESGWVGDIGLDELGPLAADQFNAVDDFGGRVVQVVGNDDLVASLEQGEGREGPDVARSSVCSQRAARGSGDANGDRIAYPVTRTVPTAIVQSIRSN
jgi:hypothetical protein